MYLIGYRLSRGINVILMATNHSINWMSIDADNLFVYIIADIR